MKPLVSFVIPAYNAENTILRTLGALFAQSQRSWEAVVVDDASSDGTFALVARAAQSDERIRPVKGNRGGVCAARNIGIEQAQGEWMVFLDADDTLDPQFLAIMLKAAEEADLVYCGHRRELSDGTELSRSFDASFEHKGFDLLVHHCAVAIHSVLFRRSLLSRVGGFDTELRICEDWDLWQRIARTGPRIKGVAQCLAVYHQTPGSLSKKTAVLLQDGLKVLRRGCLPDGRVRQPAPQWAEGLGVDVYPERATHLAVWCAAVAIGSREDAHAMLSLLDVPLAVSAGRWWELANAIVDGLSVGAGVRPEALAERYGSFSGALDQLIEALSLAAADGHTGKALQLNVERLLMSGRRPEQSIGSLRSTAGFGVDIRAFQTEYRVSSADRVVISLFRGRKALPSLYLPVCGGAVTRHDIVEAAIGKMGVVRYLAHSNAMLAPRFWGHALAGTVRSGLRRVVRPLTRRQKPRFSVVAEVRQVLTTAALRSVRARQGVPRTPGLGDAPSTAEERKLRLLGGNKAPTARKDVWEEQFSQPDPWQYSTEYEQVKYDRTLSLLRGLPTSRVLELACAEGHFTKQLAPHVDQLISADISATALQRAQVRCAEHSNIRYQQVDLLEDPFPGDMDVVLCSEVLYYMGGVEPLKSVVAKLYGALRPGGYLVTANHFLLKEDMSRSGFDWDQDYGADTIHQAIASCPGFVADASIVTELYRVDRFRKAADSKAPEVTHLPLDCKLEPEVARYVVWGGAVVRRAEVQYQRGWSIPILTYHRVAPDGPESLRQWRVTPDDFRSQMRHLRAHGYRGVTSKELAWLRDTNRPIHGRPVMITFDDGYQDFEEYAWPILVEHDFNPEVFLVTDRVGQTAAWDAAYGEPAPLMRWETIHKLHREGVTFGSHLASHAPATSLKSAELEYELRRSRSAIEDMLGAPVNSVAAPHGLFDERFALLASKTGYQVGYSCVDAPTDLRSPGFFLNRLQMDGRWGQAEFEAALMPGA